MGHEPAPRPRQYWTGGRRVGNNPFASNARTYTPPAVETHEACGVRLSGVRCGNKMKLGEIVCSSCAYAVAGELFRSGQGRKWMAEKLGHDIVTDEATRQRREREQAKKQRVAELSRVRQDRGVDVVYYVRTAPNRVKVGYTSDIARRLREYRSDETYLLAIEPGNRQLEQQRHDELRKWRVTRNREDYAEGPEVTARIAAVLAEHGDPRDWIAAHTPTKEAESA